MAASRSAAKSAADLSSVTDASKVSVVSIDALAKGQNDIAIENALSDNGEAVSALQSQIAANAAISEALAAENVDVSSVVAASLNADGSVIVYSR
jgi:hypothetical protein